MPCLAVAKENFDIHFGAPRCWRPGANAFPCHLVTPLIRDLQQEMQRLKLGNKKKLDGGLLENLTV